MNLDIDLVIRIICLVFIMGFAEHIITDSGLFDINEKFRRIIIKFLDIFFGAMWGFVLVAVFR